jgi:phage terminase large subunit
MKVETQIKLNRFQPRHYQLPIFDAIENKGYKRVLCIWARRAGKDIMAFNIMIRAALRKIGVYYYIFPTYSQAKKVIWDSISNDGVKFLDFIPEELVKSLNGQEMKITLLNGSIIQLVGSDNVDSLMGTNPIGIVFSEYALQDPRAYQFLRPILLVNQGFALFISTPRGKNNMYDLYQVAKESPDWFVNVLTIEDTGHVSIREIEKEQAEGLISADLIRQEYYCDFTMGVEGAYYAKYLDKMRLKGQIGNVPYEAGFKTHTAWDIGVRDSTSIIFFQTIGTVVHIIDYYENSKVGLEHYIKVLEQKPYVYGKHIGPHDIKVKEWGSGMTRIEKAKQLGISFTVAPDLSIEDGIESVRSAFSKIWIDDKSCGPLLKALENYRQEYDVKRKVYKANPLHDFSSHASDAMRYLCISLPKTRDGLSAEDLDKRYREAMYGDNEGMPQGFFRDESKRMY